MGAQYCELKLLGPTALGREDSCFHLKYWSMLILVLWLINIVGTNRHYVSFWVLTFFYGKFFLLKSSTISLAALTISTAPGESE